MSLKTEVTISKKFVKLFSYLLKDSQCYLHGSFKKLGYNKLMHVRVYHGLQNVFINDGHFFAFVTVFTKLTIAEKILGILL